MIINTNISALVTNHSLSKSNASTDRASKKLSTGYRVNSAADDAAGLAIANKIKTQVRGLKMADRNCNDAISLIQTAEGGLSEVQNMLQRMRELAIQGANDTLTDSDRQKIQDECDQLIDEINDTADKVQFNTKSLLNGKYDTFTFQVGPNAGLTLDVKMEEITAYKIGAITDEKNTFTSLSQMKSQPSSAIKIGIETNVPDGLEEDPASTTTPKETKVVQRVNFAQFIEADVAAIVPPSTFPITGDRVVVTTYTKGTTTVPQDTKITETGVYMLTVDDDGNKKLYDSDGNDVTEKFKKFNPDADGQPSTKPADNIGFDPDDYTPAPTANEPLLITVTSTTNEAGATIYKESITTLKVAQADPETLPNPKRTYAISADDTSPIQYAMSEDKKKLIVTDTKGKGGFLTVESCAYTALLVCDGSINDVSEFRSRLGAVQNRLEYTSSSLQTSSENAETSLSRIQDTDMASEMSEYTKDNVIVQANIAMLAQANQRPNQLLSLLQ